MSDLDPFDARLSGLLSAVSPTSRRRLAAGISMALQQSQARRIAAQQNPDGTPYEPRKSVSRLRRKKGGLRRVMFSKLRTARWMKREATAESAAVTFAPAVQHMAQVHQRGLRDRVNKSGLTAQYPARRLLGLTQAEIDDVDNRVIEHLAGGA